MERIRTLAFQWAAREAGLAALAILAAMFALAASPALALKAGALGFTALAAVQTLRAERAPTVEPDRTEIWSGLKRDERPPLPVARRLIGSATREAAATFGFYAAGTAVALWITDLAVAF